MQTRTDRPVTQYDLCAGRCVGEPVIAENSYFCTPASNTSTAVRDKETYGSHETKRAGVCDLLWEVCEDALLRVVV